MSESKDNRNMFIKHNKVGTMIEGSRPVAVSKQTTFSCRLVKEGNSETFKAEKNVSTSSNSKI